MARIDVQAKSDKAVIEELRRVADFVEGKVWPRGTRYKHYANGLYLTVEFR